MLSNVVCNASVYDLFMFLGVCVNTEGGGVRLECVYFRGECVQGDFCCAYVYAIKRGHIHEFQP